jgi:hypothetical protein
MGKKVKFSLGIGFAGENREETIFLEDLGIVKGQDYETEEELDDLLEEAWKDWSANYIDGGWEVE